MSSREDLLVRYATYLSGLLADCCATEDTLDELTPGWRSKLLPVVEARMRPALSRARSLLYDTESLDQALERFIRDDEHIEA